MKLALLVVLAALLGTTSPVHAICGGRMNTTSSEAAVPTRGSVFV